MCGTKKRRENLRSLISKPKSIQRSRAKGWKMLANTKSDGHLLLTISAGVKFGNETGSII
jgi:hypothetical protein